MLSIWLENKHPEVLERFEKGCRPLGYELKSWIEAYEIDLYRRYVEEVIKPTEVLKALLCGLTISVESNRYMMNDKNQFCQIVPFGKPTTDEYREDLIPVVDFIKVARKVRSVKDYGIRIKNN